MVAILPQDKVPALEYLEAHGGDVVAYFNHLFVIFCEDFTSNTARFRGLKVGLSNNAQSMGKPETFWHVTSEGTPETRTPDLRRCERIRWIRFALDNCDTGRVKCWENTRTGERRVLLWLDESFIVVLRHRGSHVLLLTAYCVAREHQRRKLRAEWEQWQQAQVPVAVSTVQKADAAL